MISDRAQKLFFEAQSVDPDTQVEFVRNACGDDTALFDEVSSLLQVSNESAAYFRNLSDKVGLTALADEEDAPHENASFGAWRTLHLIGSGGMGSVYLAERADGQFEQRAALKVLPTGLGGTNGRSRFLTERQILARLNHDNIARLLDGGVTDDGIPYFVMDFVDGEPIDRYCRTRGLSVNDKLRLILDIAEAVQYAHRNLVVHRDLKPGNVLVDGEGHVRLLDFGIAKILEPSEEGQNLTRLAQRPATPAYASPEMLRGDPVDATTDVYSLGVLTYSLIANQLPIEFDGLNLAQIHERAATTLPALASSHDSSIDSDLDAIVAKALEKERDARYSSVEAFAQDLKHYLSGLPVSARPQTTAYRLRMFARRHRVGFAFAMFAVLSLGSILGLAIYSAITADRQAAEIALERDRAEQVRDFLVSIFDSADPNKAAPDLTARELLDAGRQRIATELSEQPELQIDLAMTIGEVYASVRMVDEWREMLEMELELRQDLTGTDNIDYVDTLFGMSQLEDMSGNYDQSQSYAEEALDIAKKLNHVAGQAFAHMRVGRAVHLKGNYDEAEYHYRRSLALNSAEIGDRAIATNEVRMHLSTLLNHREKYDDALQMLETVYEIRQEHFPGDHGEYSEVFLAMGVALSSLERYEDAIEIYERAYAMNERLFGPENRRNLFIVNGLGKVAEAMEQYDLAADRYRQAIEMTKLYFPGHPNLAIATANLGKVLSLEENYAAALIQYREAVAIMESAVPSHWGLGDMRWRLGRCIAKTGGDYAEAELLILKGIERLEEQWGADHQSTSNARAAAAELYLAWGKPEEARSYQDSAN